MIAAARTGAVPHPAEPVLRPIVIEFPYRHSTGPVVGRALAGFRDRQILGGRCAGCRIVAPPAREWCEHCAGPIHDLLPVGPGGAVTVAAAVHEPPPTVADSGAQPFSWALVRLDGADTDLLHVVRGTAGPGTRVRPVWAAQRRGAVTDLLCFEAGEPVAAGDRPEPGEPVAVFERHLALPFSLAMGDALSRFVHALRDEGRIYGVRCTSCRMVIVPPRICCPRCWADTEDWIPVADHGTVTTFVAVNVPFYGQQMPLPYVLAHIRLDGADTPILHVLEGVEPAKVRTGMRVEAVWTEGRTGLLNDDIRAFRPAADPDPAE